jgi:hypothetical protein
MAALWKLKLPSSYYSYKKKKAGHKLSAATKAKISRALKGRKRKKAPHPHKGHPLSAATKAKISRALKGKTHPGHAVSGATRAKISAALKGKPHAGHPLSAATKAKISAALKNATHKSHPMSAATRAKLSAAMSARDRALAKAHLSTRSTAARKVKRPQNPWKNPVRRSQYRFVTANARHRPPPALVRRKRFRHRGPNLHTRLRYHRVWRPRRRRRR